MRKSARRSRLTLFAGLVAALVAPALAWTSGGAQAVADASGGVFVPVTPMRIVSATTWTGGTGNFTAGETRSFQILGTAGVPASGVSAVVVDLAAHGTTTTSSSYLTAWASGVTRPVVSSMFYTQENVPRSNTAIVPIGSNGKISLYNYTGTTSVTIDIQGYFTSTSTGSSTGGFIPLEAPKRVANTNSGVGSTGSGSIPAAPIPVGGSLDVQVTGQGSIEEGATAVFANVEAFGSATGALRVGPGNTTLTGVAAIEYGDSGRYDSGVMVKLNANGRMRITNSLGSNVNVKIDVQGYFTGDPDEGGSYTPLTPTNVYSTASSGQTDLGGGETRTVQISGLAGISSEASAAALTVQVKNWTAGGTVAIFAADIAWPGTSNVGFNYNAGAPANGLSSTAIARLSDTGKISIHNTSSQAVRVTLTAQGWFSRYEELDPPEPPDVEPVEPTTTIYDGVNTDELADLESSAQANGTSLQTEVDEYAKQEEFGAFVTEVAEANPDTFSYSDLGDVNEDPVVAFSEPDPEIPTEMADVVEDLDIQIETVAYSENEVAQASQLAANELADWAGNGSTVVVTNDPGTTKLYAAVFAPNPAAPSASTLEGAAYARIVSQMAPMPDLPDVTVTKVEAPPVEDTELRGGVRLFGYINESQGAACTSAFPAYEDATGITGYLTAGHCPNATHYYWSRRGISIGRLALHTRMFELPVAWGDLQYHRSRNLEPMRTSFYVLPDSKRNLHLKNGRSFVRPSLKDKVCVFGRTTNGYKNNKRTCSTVGAVNVWITTKSPINGALTDRGRMVALRRNMTKGGDSGGPAYYGNLAFGVNSGSGDTCEVKPGVVWPCTLITPMTHLGKQGFNVTLVTDGHIE